LKEKGNKFFFAKKFPEAIKCYTKAIDLNPNMAAFYTNRALCNLNLKQWTLVCQDCRIAIDLDPNKVKGYLYMGQALMEMRMYDESIASLTKANDLASNQKHCYTDEIHTLLRLAKKRKLLANEEAEYKSITELQTLLSRLLEEKKERFALIGLLAHLAFSYWLIKLMRAEMTDLFKKAEILKNNRNIPDVMCGKISFELIRDPVITPGGITYDRRDIEEHLLKVGHFDPITRCPLSFDQLIPNAAMKEVLDKYIKDNPWS
ncbi:hypothetical protein HELRODRAFT_123811, partial [Helobdella robusta]|uniref:E3 ubiquitin-protein ligase CHIP n=1 Tax=Helobdella robusta TaxID=6412 RepID=T1EGZ1_HELRO